MLGRCKCKCALRHPCHHSLGEVGWLRGIYNHSRRQSPQKLFGLILERGWIWLDFPDFRYEYIKEVYWSHLCFVGHGPWTGDFRSDCRRQTCFNRHIKKNPEIGGSGMKSKTQGVRSVSAPSHWWTWGSGIYTDWKKETKKLLHKQIHPKMQRKIEDTIITEH